MAKNISIIAAVSDNNVIGYKGEIPWFDDVTLKREDLQRFKRLTLGHPIVMGRKTYESIIKINGKPLEGRLNIVLSRDPNFSAPGVVACYSPKKLVYEPESSFYIIGGAKIYSLMIPLATELNITRVHANFKGDAFFPDILPKVWKEENIERRQGDKYSFDFVTYVRR